MAKNALPNLRVANVVADGHVAPNSNLDERIRIIPLAEFLLELATLVNDDLPIVADAESPAFERSRGRAFEVHARDVEARAMARAFEFLVRFEPIGCAAEMRAGRA